MKKSIENIMPLLRGRVAGMTLRSDDYRFSELLAFARLAASKEVHLTLVVGDNLTAAEVVELARTAHGFLHIDLK